MPALSDWGDCFQAFAKRLIENPKIYNWLFQSSVANYVFGANFFMGNICACAIQIALKYSFLDFCRLGSSNKAVILVRIETEI